MESYCRRNKSEKRIMGFNNLGLLLLVFVSVALILFCLLSNSGMEIERGSMLMSIKDEHENHLLQNSNGEKTMEVVKAKLASVGGVRRLLVSGGSAPPNCKSKCGKCKPCKSVLVRVPPVMSVTTNFYPPAPETYFPTQYYAEKWWCKCGGKLYRP